MTINLKDNERFDDLQRNGYRIIQETDGFCFGTDTVLLSGFAQMKDGERALDLGTGTGIIPILLEVKTGGKHFTGLEIQEEMTDIAVRSVLYNHLEDKIETITRDIREVSWLFGLASFDVVTSNPSYMNGAHGPKNPGIQKAMSRHEVLYTLEDVVREASRLLRPGGRFYMAHRLHRLIETITALTKHKLEPKRMRFVHPYVDKDANMVLIGVVRGGKPMMKLEAPIIVYKERGVYTDEICDIYGH